MYKKDIHFTVVEIIDISSTRLIGVELKRHNQKPLFFCFCLYILSDSKTQQLQNICISLKKDDPRRKQEQISLK